MLRKFGFLTVILLFFAIIICGVIKTASETVPYVKEKSAVKVYYTAKPFEVKIDIGDYIIYLNGGVFKNIKNLLGEL